MSKIIIPGQEKQQKQAHIYDNIRERVKADWNERVFINQQFDLFLHAVQQEVTKEYQYDSELAFIQAGSPRWNEESSFDEWMDDVRQMYEFRLRELKQRKEDSSKSFPHIIKLVREAQEAGQAQGMMKGIGEQMKPEDYEVFEFIIRKSLEAVRKYRKGLLNVTPPENMSRADLDAAEKLAKKIINS